MPGNRETGFAFPGGAWFAAYAADAEHDIEVQITSVDGGGQPDVAAATNAALLTRSAELTRKFPISLPSRGGTPFFVRARHVRDGKNPSAWTPWRRVIGTTISATPPPDPSEGAVPIDSWMYLGETFRPTVLAIFGFDDGQGTRISDFAGGPPALITVAGAGWVPAAAGGAYDFNNVGVAVCKHETAHDIGAALDFTIDTVVRWDGGSGYIFSHESDYWLHVSAAGDLTYSLRDHYVTQTPGVNLNTLGQLGKLCHLKWQYVASTSTSTFWINGELVAAHVSAGAASGAAIADTLVLGDRLSSTDPWDGLISYLRLATGLLNDFPALAEATSERVGQGLDPSGRFRFTAANVLASSGREDLILNGDFEDGLSYWNGDGTIDLGADVYKGTRSLKHTHAGASTRKTTLSNDGQDAAAGREILIRVFPNDRLRVRVGSKLSAASGVTSQIGFRLYKHDRTLDTDTTFSQLTWTTETAWTEKEFVINLTGVSDIYYIGIYLTSTTTGAGSAWFDEVHIWRAKRTNDIVDNAITSVKIAQNAALRPSSQADVTGNITLDFSSVLQLRLRLTGNVTVTAITMPPDDGAVAVVRALQDGTGGRSLTWPASVHWNAGAAPAPNTAANRRAIYTFWHDGGVLYGSMFGGDFA